MCDLSPQAAPDIKYYVAMVDYMKQTSRDIRMTPTFCIYKGTKKVDQFVGDHPQRIADRIWLWSDIAPSLE